MIRVILVDDHKLFVDGLVSILTKEIGIEIIATAGNGLELLELMETHNPNIILTDIRMPILDGISLTKHFRKKFPSIGILALSMLDQEEDVIDMLDAGAKGYLVKNAEKEELVRAIHEVAKGNFYFSDKFKNIYQSWSSNSPSNSQIKLTRRERQILELLVLGKTSQQMANALNLSKFTIDTHRKNIHKKLGTKSNFALVRMASRFLDN
ncbi:response regulator transcription factor [Muriicola sp. Z0-33]|uniref:response regulator transcription factor n=1 Tax=Muriicola sp. Z0-33 TaxID=2816957 RepID=UPI0022389494|nr:response regulator transcription factor [Muriicola sp. Z0-33]MCW5517314.1 response regulator transcription factor [Muriicola sp. Z0-33]